MSSVSAPLRVLLLPALLLVALGCLPAARAAGNSTYTLASPRVFIRPPLPNTKLELLGSNLTVDLDAGRFYQTVSTYFASNEKAGTLPTVTLVGYISFNLQGKVLFSFPSTTELYCQQSISSPSLCPYLQQLVANVPYVFGAIPSSGNTVELTLSADATYIDPITNGPINFLGANQALTFACAGTCEEFGAGVPPAPMPENATVDNLFVADAEQVGCHLSVGFETPVNVACGDFEARRLYVGNQNATANSLFTHSVFDYRGVTSTATLPLALSVNHYCNGSSACSPRGIQIATGWDAGAVTSASDFATGLRVFSSHSGSGATTTHRGVQANMVFSTTSGNSNGYVAFSTNGVTIPAGSSAVVGTVIGYRAEPSVVSGGSVTSHIGFGCLSFTNGANSNVCFQGVDATAGTNRAIYHMNTNTASCAAGLVAGTAFDTCLYRGRAGAWTGPAGTDIYTDSGYICAGTGCSSVTSTNTGVYDAGVRVMSSVSCTGATCSLTNGALSVTVTGTTSATVSAKITGGGSCGGSVSVLGSWSNMRVTLITGTGPGCSVPGDDVFQVVRGTACGSSGVPVCNISPGDDVSPPLTWNGPSGSGTTRIARTPSYGSTLSVSTTYYYDIRCGCTTD